MHKECRYGFNGKEKDDEMSGNGNSYDYGFRIYNPRIGRFLSVDPLFKGFPWWTPYQFAGNTPIQAIDLDGLEIYFATDGAYIGKWGTSTAVRVIADKDVNSFTSNLQSASKKAATFTERDVMYNYWAGSSGSSSPSAANKKMIEKTDVIDPSTHESYSDIGDCYASACATLENNNMEVGEYWGDKQYEFQMYTETNAPNVDISETRKAGFDKINSELEAGNPVLVGVDYSEGSSNGKTDGTTDHFIVITGRGIDKAGNLFYSAFENVDSGDKSNGTSRDLNRFYLQEDGTLQGGTTYTGGMTVTQVKPVKQ